MSYVRERMCEWSASSHRWVHPNLDAVSNRSCASSETGGAQKAACGSISPSISTECVQRPISASSSLDSVRPPISASSSVDALPRS